MQAFRLDMKALLSLAVNMHACSDYHRKVMRNICKIHLVDYDSGGSLLCQVACAGNVRRVMGTGLLTLTFNDCMVDTPDPMTSSSLGFAT